MENNVTQSDLDLAMTYSAYREMELVPRRSRPPLRPVPIESLEGEPS